MRSYPPSFIEFGLRFAQDLLFGALLAGCPGETGLTGLSNRSEFLNFSLTGLTGLSKRSDRSDSAELQFGEFSCFASAQLPRAFRLEIASS